MKIQKAREFDEFKRENEKHLIKNSSYAFIVCQIMPIKIIITKVLANLFKSLTKAFVYCSDWLNSILLICFAKLFIK